MKNNKDDKRDNVDGIQYKADKTLENFRETEEMIEKTNDDNMKNALEAKNDRRIETFNNFKKEVKEEALGKQNEYK